ncbi:MAG: CoB--CoM heterodisulfide reductase iron-sulfur subunit A family protein, partial [Candidatus Thorarchaeota archaeon]
EREKELGGNLRNLYYIAGKDGWIDAQEQLNSIVEDVSGNDLIHVYAGAEIVNTDGYIGNFNTIVNHAGEEKTIQHGVVIIATGGVEYKPTEYFYGKDDRVLTQLELEEKIAKGEFSPGTTVMIQCVGARTEERPNCSRICCGHAVKNALKLKELDPEADDDDNLPEVTNSEGLRVVVKDPVTAETLLIKANHLVLSAATLPQETNQYISQLLKCAISKDGYFLEAHMKLRPIDFATDGVFLCGLAQWPKFIDESISQACGTAARAATILSKTELEIEAVLANVDEDLCSGCGTCVYLCPFGAIEKDDQGVAKVTLAQCKGCGICGASCPERAITILHFTDDQIVSQGLAVLRRVSQ